MAEFDRRTLDMRTGTQVGIDQGLRSYMLRVYNYMGLGLLLTGVVAYLTNSMAVTTNAASAAAQGPSGVYLTQFGVLMYTSPLMWVFALAPLAFILVMNFGLNKMSASTLQMVFWAFATAMGLSLASIFLVYTSTSIARVFFITAATFGSMSLYGYTTKRDLTGMGSFLMMGLIGIIIASVVNIFMASSALAFGISVLGVLIFVGLTAYDTQRIKQMYYEGDGAEVMSKKAIMGATSLYLDFINLFLMLLRLFGNRN